MSMAAMNTGRTETNACDVVMNHPEVQA